jgi:hypothetical protein
MADLGVQKGAAEVNHIDAQTDYARANTNRTQALTSPEAAKTQAEADYWAAGGPNAAKYGLSENTLLKAWVQARDNDPEGTPADYQDFKRQIISGNSPPPAINFSGGQPPVNSALAGAPMTQFLSPDRITQATGLTGGRALAGPPGGDAGQATGQQAPGQANPSTPTDAKSYYISLIRKGVPKEQAMTMTKQMFGGK